MKFMKTRSKKNKEDSDNKLASRQEALLQMGKCFLQLNYIMKNYNAFMGTVESGNKEDILSSSSEYLDETNNSFNESDEFGYSFENENEVSKFVPMKDRAFLVVWIHCSWMMLKLMTYFLLLFRL